MATSYIIEFLENTSKEDKNTLVNFLLKEKNQEGAFVKSYFILMNPLDDKEGLDINCSIQSLELCWKKIRESVCSLPLYLKSREVLQCAEKF